MDRVALIIIGGILFVILLGWLAYMLVFRSLFTAPTPSPSPVSFSAITTATPSPATSDLFLEGTVIDKGHSSLPNSTFLKVLPRDGRSAVNVEVNANTKIIDQAKQSNVELSKGFTVRVLGTTIDETVQATEVIVIKSPNIVIFSPAPNEVVGASFELRGIARVFENRFTLRVVNARNGNIYVNMPLTSNAPDVGRYGEFTYLINLTNNLGDLKPGDPLTLEAFQGSPRDGREEDKVTLSLKFQ